MKTLNIKTLLVVLFAATISTSSFAQDRYVLNNFWDNWFMSYGVGGQYYWGGNQLDEKPTISEHSTITYNVALGKWVTPSFGIRTQFNYTPAVTRYTNTPEQTAQGVKTSMEVMNAHADLMFNLSNIIGGYKDKRFYQAVMYVGGGYARSNWSIHKWDNTISGNAGLINRMRICSHLDFNIELAATAYPKAFDGITAANYPYDAQFQATAGITYRFGNKAFEKNVKAVEVDLTPYNNRIKELENSVSDANARAAELNKRIMELQNRKPAVVAKQEVIDLAGATTFFNLNSSKLGPRDIVNLEELAAFIKQTPDVKYKLSGLIDYASGSKELNDKLCAARVQSVYNELVKLGISESQLVKATELPTSPSKNPILNRGVVVSTSK